ncbi:lasso RiPP family leader peptide-containing protein [Streptomyces sp. NPDC059788]
MQDELEVSDYEVPELVEAGVFAEVTLGSIGAHYDGNGGMFGHW